MEAAKASPERAPIRVLSPEVANQIAAGEVIERPASVVKELVENALDAGARRIRIEVRGGGKELIRVSDDGYGIPDAEAPLAFERHATSKIETAADLAAVTTLGFRGEALPSIASVAQVELVTRVAGQAHAVRIRRRGADVETGVAGAPVGTSVTVSDLFYNTPARFKFLKADATERRYIAEMVTNLALARPEVAFHLQMEGKEVLRTPGTGHLSEAIAAVYGREIIPDLVQVAWETPALRVTGYVGKPVIAKGNRSGQCLVVNGRWVQNRTLAAAVEKGYESLLAHRRFPVAILHIEIDPAAVDVNVHPAKTEVRFRDERAVFRTIMLAVRQALTAADLVVDIGAGDRESSPAPVRAPLPGVPEGDRRPDLRAQEALVWEEPPPAGTTSQQEQSAIFWVGEARTTWQPSPPSRPGIAAPWFAAPAAEEEREEDAGEHAGLALAEERANEEGRMLLVDAEARGLDPRALLREAVVCGQVLNTYLLLPVPHGLWLIDQHVAHERILYEQALKAATSAGRPPSQELLVPATLTLSPALAAAVEERLEYLDRLGFALEPFGPREFLVRAVPATWKDPSPRRLTALLEELASVLSEGGPNLHERAAAALACRGAVKAGEAMAPEAMNRLVRALATVSNPFACPHGRPVIVQLHRREIERRFGRR